MPWTCDMIKLEKCHHPTIQTEACCACAIHTNVNDIKGKWIRLLSHTYQQKPRASGINNRKGQFSQLPQLQMYVKSGSIPMIL
jgi:hypothetical protein